MTKGEGLAPERGLEGFDGRAWRPGGGDDARFLFKQAIECRRHGVDLVDRHHDRAVTIGVDEVAAVHAHAMHSHRNAEFDDMHISV